MAVADVLKAIDGIQEWQEELYRHFHRNPELPMQETETLAEITRRLDQYGYQTQQIGGGVVGVLRNGDGPTVLFRADIDALPVKETTGLAYASTRTATNDNGQTVPVMHACGHDMHIAAGLGVAWLLANHLDAWTGTYIALFQPGEEIAAGARSMVADGLVAKVPKPDVAMGQHVLSEPAAGKVGTLAGPMMATGVCVRVTVFGKGTHGAMPHRGVDPVVLASSIVLRLQTLVSRELDPLQMGVVTVGSIQAGTKANIIPDDATLLLNIRAYDNAVRERLLAGIERIVRAECQASGSPQEPKFELYDSYPLTDNDAAVTEKITAAFVEHLGADRVEKLAQVPASEDFSVIPDAFGVPYCYWGFGGFTANQQALPNHNPGFAPAIQPTLRTGTEAAVVAVLAWLGK